MGAINRLKKATLVQIVGNLVQLCLFVFLLGISVSSFATRIPFLSRLGLNFYTVISGSMEPTIPVGSLIYVSSFNLQDLKAGDIISYQVGDSKEMNIVTHRIAEVKKLEEKTYLKYEFVTKGDANNTVDINSVQASQVLGVYQWHIPKFGYLTNFSQTAQGFLVLVVLPAIILIGWEVVSLILHLKRYYEEKSKKEIETMRKKLAKEKK